MNSKAGFQFISYKFEDFFECIFHIVIQLAAQYIVFFAVMEMMWKRLNLRMVERIIPAMN